MLAVALTALLPLAVLQLEPVRRMAAGALADVVAAQTGWRLEVGTLHGLWPFRIWLGDVRLSDAGGRWLSISDVRITVLPWPRSGGLVDLDAALKDVQVSRIPATPPPSQPSPPLHPLAFLDTLAPVPVDFSARAAVDGLHLEQPVAGQAMTLNISVDARNSGGTLSIGLKADRSDGPPTRLELAAGLEGSARAAKLDIGLEEAAGGMVSGLAGLGADMPLSFRLKGAGPLAQWNANLTGKRGDENILEGSVRAALGRSSVEDARFGLGLTLHPATLPLAEQARVALGQKAELAFSGVLTSAGLPAPKWKLLVEDLSVSAQAGSAHLKGDAGVDWLTPRLSFSAALSDPKAAGLPVGPVELRGEARADIDPAGPVSAGADIEVPGLSAALEPANVGLGGQLRLRATLEGDLAGKDMSFGLDGGIFEITGAGKAPDWAKAADALGREVTLKARARLDPQRTLTLSDTRVAARSFSAEVSGTYGLDSGNIDASLALDAPDLSLFSGAAGKPVGGRLKAQTLLRGTASAPAVSLTLTSERAAYENTRFDKAGAEAEVEVQPDGSSRGRMSASVSHGNAKLEAQAGFVLARGKLEVSGLKVAGPGVDAAGDLDVKLETSTASGKVKAGVDLGGLGGFLNMAMSGTARLEAVLSESGPRQDATVSLSASAVKGFGLNVAKAEVSGSATDVTHAPKGKLAATVTGAKMGTAGVESLTIQASGNGKETSFSLSARGTLPEPFDAATAGVFATSPGGGRLSLNDLRANAYGTRLALVRPASVAFGPAGFSLAGLSMSLGTARITASGEMKANSVTLAADVAEFPLDILGKARVAEGLSGTAKASLRVSGSPQSPKINATLDVSQVRYAQLQDKKAPAIDVAAAAEYSQGRVAAHARVEAGAGNSMEARAIVPARLSLKPVAFSMPGDPSLEASLQGTVELATFAAFAGEEGLDMRGTLKADLTARGRLKAPEVSGSIVLENGSVEYADSGTVLRNIVLRVEAAGPAISIREFSASDAGSGKVSAQGQVNFPPDGRFSLAMDISLDKAALVRTDTASATLSGHLAVSGDLSGVLVKGNISTGQVEVNIPHRIPPDVTPVKVHLVHAPQNLQPRQAQKPAGETASGASGTGSPGPLPVRLDMDVDFPGHIFVRGYGLDSVWDGRLHVGGTAASPSVSGDINVVRGRIDFFDKPFQLVRGAVSFTGPPTVPRLDIDAQYQSSDITADILVTGDAVHPKVSFSSVPALPQDEILSRVLFGKSVSGLTAPQALQLAQAAASLTGKGDTLDLLGKTRKLVGLDYLGLGPSKGPDTGQMAITAGKYISDKVYVETSQGLGGQGPKVSVQVDVYPNVTVDSSMGMDSKTGVGLNWKMDY
jgi:translocation and assembly module TamB